MGLISTTISKSETLIISKHLDVYINKTVFRINLKQADLTSAHKQEDATGKNS